MILSQNKILKKRAMKNTVVILVLFSFVSVCYVGCKTQKDTQNTSISMALPPTIIYKTTKNYDKNVAILLSEDKTKITGFPATIDVSARSYPTVLKKGYLLDNRGISKNIAFISLTYEEYAVLKKTPSISELDSMIIDRNPIKEMYYCEHGVRYSERAELDKLIDSKFKGCRRVK